MTPLDWNIVRATPLFGAMPPEVVQSLVGHSSPRLCEKGVVLFQQGDRAKDFFLMLEGWVKLYRLTPEGDEAVVAVFKRGETFAEGAMFIGGRYPVSAETVAPSRVLQIDGTALRRKIHENPEIAFAMLASASAHLKALVDQIEQIKLLSAPQRMAQFLLRLCPGTTGSAVVGLPYEKALIANRLGMKPESLSRSLSRLRSLGVTVDREQVRIADVERLAAFIEHGDIDDR
jgi:CRP-like cAMP-binding protein